MLLHDNKCMYSTDSNDEDEEPDYPYHGSPQCNVASEGMQILIELGPPLLLTLNFFWNSSTCTKFNRHLSRVLNIPYKIIIKYYS